MYFMKTKARTIRVSVLICGVPTMETYSIRSRSGKLMTNQLKQILSGSLGHSHGRGHDDHSVVELIGVKWEPPYTILQELMTDRIALQAEVLRRDGHSKLTDDGAYLIPAEATDEYISKLVLFEIRMRKALRQELRMLDAAAKTEKAT